MSIEEWLDDEAFLLTADDGLDVGPDAMLLALPTEPQDCVTSLPEELDLYFRLR